MTQYAQGACRHPGGEALTQRLLSLAGLPPCRILDMGAGAGVSLRYLRKKGFDAQGIDVQPGEDVQQGDFLHCPFPDASFDAVFSECAFFVSGDVPGALREAARLLRPKGTLLFSDVFFGAEEALRALTQSAGFRVLHIIDETELWREYYLRCVWEGTENTLCDAVPSGKCFYYLLIGEKE